MKAPAREGGGAVVILWLLLPPFVLCYSTSHGLLVVQMVLDSRSPFSANQCTISPRIEAGLVWRAGAIFGQVRNEGCVWN